MMLTRLVRNQLVIFAVLTMVSVSYVGAKYVDIARLLGIGTFQVTAQLAATGGLYQNAIVTYNGVQVGLVKAVTPTRNGVVADLRINNGTRIPADLTAAVHSTSPVGEQYIDLKPLTTMGPVLVQGSVIRQNQTTLPTTTNDLLNSLDSFAATVPQGSYRTTVDELAAATNGSGPALHSLLAASQNFLAQAQSNITGTTGLIDELAPFLATQQDLGPDIRNSLTNLALFADKLASSDRNLRSILSQGPAFTHSVDHLLDDLDQPLPMLLANLTAGATVLRTYIPEIRQTLVIVPPLLVAIENATVPHQDIHAVALNFRANVDDPPYCKTGYEPGTGRDPSLVAPTAPKDGIYCKESHNSPLVVRGDRNAPCPNSSQRAAEAKGCGLDFTNPPRPKSSWRGANLRTYDPANGTFTSSDGRSWQLGSPTRPERAVTDAHSFLLRPVS